MWNLKLSLLIVFLSIIHFIQQKKLNLSKPATELLQTEEKRLTKEKSLCPLKFATQKVVDSYRFHRQEKTQGYIIPCIIELIKKSQYDGWLWSLLGDAYLTQGKKYNNHANTCFKQAVKFDGKISPFVKEWNFIGPFVIGKTELDGDPVEYYGGIKNISKFRKNRHMNYYSELIPSGVVEWKVFQSESSNAAGLKISPQVNWNDLVSSLGSMGITEWQGWVVGEFSVNEKDLNIAIQCLGVHTIFIDDFITTGDVYHRDKFWFSTTLSRGLHTIYIRLRTKVLQHFKCSLRHIVSSFEILNPPFLPDLLDGFIFSSVISIPVVNHHRSKWLKIIRVSVESQSKGISTSFTASQIGGNQFSVAPGQTHSVNIELKTDRPKVTEECNDDLEISLLISTSEGQRSLPIKLRCRKSTESFLFTFIDHDGSVQHAAAIQPRGYCGETSRQLDYSVCPVLLTLHGTTVPPQNQADSYKHMVNTKFVFGVDTAWLLAPTRHGAHNWEGPGALTAMTALQRLSELSTEHEWIEQKASSEQVIFAGHSMGGHGAWHVATHFPDRALALVSLAGWIKKEEYGDSNLFFKHDISTSHTDPAVKAVMEACIAENDADRHVSNLQGIPVLTRIGDSDRTVHPFFSRRMFRRLMEEKIQATYTEIKGKEHWWWDTWETNDGGAVNDKQLRDFTNQHTFSSRGGDSSSCVEDGGSCSTEGSHRVMYNTIPDFTYVTFNPAFGEGMRGLRVLQQITPFRKSEIKLHTVDGAVQLTTVNVARFDIREPENRPINWNERTISIDSQLSVSGEKLRNILLSSDAHFCRLNKKWQICEESLGALKTRGPHSLGPARRIAENRLVIVTGTQGSESQTQRLLNQAVYIANLFYLTSDAFVPVLRDVEADITKLEHTNVIVLGSPDENSLTSHFLTSVPLQVDKGSITLQDCMFENPRTGLMTLTPHGNNNLGMVIMGLGFEGMLDAVSLATPTIPPMTRSPFSNLLPDFVITGPDFGKKGPGGFECAGFWGNNWEYRADLVSCVCQTS